MPGSTYSTEAAAQADLEPDKFDGPKKLIVCIDGTGKKYSDKNTNVVELYSHIEKSKHQLTYYNSGIGTYAQPTRRSISHLGQVINSAIDAVLARNIEKVIIGAYRWLSDHYRPGDEIFLFGFSRGAYQVRALAGMIETVGLIFPGNQEQIPFAFEMYAKYGKCDAGDKPYKKHSEEYRAKVSKFKATFSRERVSIKFLGAWDTVSSVGMWRGKLLPLTNECGHIVHFRHALALDERRVKYIPEHVTTTSRDEGHIKEVWFAGTHSDMYVFSTESLIWMITEAKNAGLQVDARVVGTGIGKKTKIKDSLRGFWWICEILPVSRLSNKSEEKRTIR
ncbi:hypothetical protein BDV93DRAFT_452546 [Ceratobasidium sp. AG-I]|nr:hypothetical protein BDV93DRAFT_452546 [Ceratobasidium sp. AG-I]